MIFSIAIKDIKLPGQTSATPVAGIEPVAEEKPSAPQKFDSAAYSMMMDHKPLATEEKASFYHLKVRLILGFGALVVLGALVTLGSLAAQRNAEKRMYAPEEEVSFYEERSIEYARSESGFFAQFFCRGSQRSVFCD